MALKQCAECGKDISDQASNCPSCGAPQVSRAKSADLNKGIGCVAVIAIAVVIGFLAKGGGAGSSSQSNAADPVNSMIAEFRSKQPQCRVNVEKMQSLGATHLRESDGMTIAQIDERVWNALEHDDKVRQAALIFCARMPDDGHYTVLIKGLHDGETKGSMIDGNYLD